MQILLIEDDDRLAGFVANALEQEGHVVRVESDGRSGLLAASSDSYDLIILDRMLPKVDGLRILQTLRGMDDPTPVLILSALSDVDERVRGLRAGGDDYLAKPFSIEELIARIEVLGRRLATPPATSRFSIGSIVVDPVARLVWRGDQRIELTNREFRILECLARHSGRVVTRSLLLEYVWDYHFDPQTNVIDQHVSRLRQKLDDGSGESLIETVRGSGYRLAGGVR